MDIILLPFYAIVTSVGIFGNSLFIAVVRKRRSMQTVINFLLTNVAVSDIVSLVFLVPGIILRFFKHPSGNLGNFLCKFVTTHRIARDQFVGLWPNTYDYFGGKAQCVVTTNGFTFKTEQKTY